MKAHPLAGIRSLFLGDPSFVPRVCYAQDGKDLILGRLMEGRSTGFYVDFGAHNPARFSNTNLLYLRGWRGINIDVQPGSMALFRRRRLRDITASPEAPER